MSSLQMAEWPQGLIRPKWLSSSQGAEQVHEILPWEHGMQLGEPGRAEELWKRQTPFLEPNRIPT